MCTKVIVIPVHVPLSYYAHPEMKELMFSQFLIEGVLSSNFRSPPPRPVGLLESRKARMEMLQVLETRKTRMEILQEYIKDNFPFLYEHHGIQSWGFVSSYSLRTIATPRFFVIQHGGGLLIKRDSESLKPLNLPIWHV